MPTPLHTRYALTNPVYLVMCSDDTWNTDYEICACDTEEAAQDICNELNEFYNNIKEFTDNEDFIELYDKELSKETIQSRLKLHDDSFPIDIPSENYFNFVKQVYEVCQRSDNPKFNTLSYQDVVDRCIDIDHGYLKGKRIYYPRALKVLARK